MSLRNNNSTGFISNGSGYASRNANEQDVWLEDRVSGSNFSQSLTSSGFHQH